MKLIFPNQNTRRRDYDNQPNLLCCLVWVFHFWIFQTIYLLAK